MDTMRAVLFFAIFNAVLASLQQGNFIHMQSFTLNSTVSDDQYRRYLDQLERAYRAQPGYKTRTLLRLPDSWVQMVVFDTDSEGETGIPKAANDSAIRLFNELVTYQPSMNLDVIRVYSTQPPTAPSAGNWLLLDTFGLQAGLTSQDLLDAAFAVHQEWSTHQGYLEMAIFRDTNTKYYVQTSWLDEASYQAAEHPNVTAELYATRDNASNLTAVYDESWVDSWGTPGAVVVLESFSLNLGVSESTFLTQFASAERALREEKGYLGRNLLKGFRRGQYWTEWWWKDSDALDNSAVATFDVNALINQTTRVEHRTVNGATFFPASGQVEIPCGAPYDIEVVQSESGQPLLTSENRGRFYELQQLYFEELRAQAPAIPGGSGFIYGGAAEVTSSPEFQVSSIISTGYSYSTRQEGFQAEEQSWARNSSVTQELFYGVLPSYAAVVHRLSYVKGFWPGYDTLYKCGLNFTVDPASTGATWLDPALRRPAPEHVVYTPAPGIASKGRIMLFLPDYGKAPTEYVGILEDAASLGYLAIGLAYRNGVDVPRLCIDESVCFYGSWEALIEGSHVSSPKIISVDRTNSIEGRLTSLLQELNITHPELMPTSFLTSDSKLEYSKIAVNGEGMGASIAYAWATRQPLNRAIAHNGPVDDFSLGNAWMRNTELQVSNTSLYSVMSSTVPDCRTSQENLRVMGTPDANSYCFGAANITAEDIQVENYPQMLEDLRTTWYMTMGDCMYHYPDLDLLFKAVVVELGDTGIEAYNTGAFYCTGTGVIRALEAANQPNHFDRGVCAQCAQFNPRKLMAVSVLGQDSGECSIETPCRTINYAISQAVGETLIQVQRGTHTGDVHIPEGKDMITLVGYTDDEGNPETVLAPATNKHALRVSAQRATISKFKFSFTDQLPGVQEVGIIFDHSAYNSIVLNSAFERQGLIDTTPASAGVMALGGATDLGVYDCKFTGTFANPILHRGNASAILRNYIKGARGDGIVVAGDNSTANSVNENVVRDVEGDGIQIQGEGNQVIENRVWRNYGFGIQICGSGSTCADNWNGNPSRNNVVQGNWLSWNQKGYTHDAGLNTNLVCYSKDGVPSVYAPASCTPNTWRVHATGNDATCVVNSETLRCRTVAGTLAKAGIGHTILLGDASYSESVNITTKGITLRGTQLGTRVQIQPADTEDVGIAVSAPEVRLEEVHVQYANILPPTNVQVGIDVVPGSDMTVVEDCVVNRALPNPSVTHPFPESYGIRVTGTMLVEVRESVLRGNLFYGIWHSAANSTITENEIGPTIILNGITILQTSSDVLAFSGNEISFNNLITLGKDGIQIQSSYNRIYDNRITYANGTGVHICGYSPIMGAGGSCDGAWHTISPPQLTGGNFVARNAALRNSRDFSDDNVTTQLDDILLQLPVYDAIGIQDPAPLMSNLWVTVGPYIAVVGGTVPMQVFGLFDRGYVPVSLRIAGGRDGCYGNAPVTAGGVAEGEVSEDRGIAYLGPISMVGDYRVCIKHRKDWEETETILSVIEQDLNKVYYGAPSCQSALDLAGSNYCGCYYQRGQEMDWQTKFSLSDKLPLTVMTSGDAPIHISQGCCQRNTKSQSKSIVDESTSWGLCSNLI